MLNKVLIIDSHRDITEAVACFLKSRNFDVYQEFTGAAAMERFNQIRPDVILMDTNLPDVHGEELCKEFKKHIHVGVIYLSTKHEKKHQLQAFHAGADDYIIKPFDYDILLARMQNLIQKIEMFRKSDPEDHIRSMQTIHYDIYKNDVMDLDLYLGLTPTEFRIFYYLARKNSYVTPMELLSHLYEIKEGHIEHSRTISVHIANIRKKLQKAKKDHIQILSRYKEGYKLIISPK